MYPNGSLQGDIPLTPGDYPVGIYVTDANLTTASYTFMVRVLAVPTITSLTPASVPEGSGDTLITIHGSGFISDSKVYVSGVPIGPVVFVSTSELQVTIAASAFATPGNRAVAVNNLPPYGIRGFTVQLPVTAP